MRRGSLLAACALAIAGCGGGGGAGSQGRGGASSEPGGAAVSVRAENRRHGTLAWRLPSSPGPGLVEGYVSDQDIAPGQVERFYVNAPGAKWVRVELFRLGWYGGLGGRLITRSGKLPAVRQPSCPHDTKTGRTECHWQATWSLRLPKSLVSGVYLGKLVSSTGAERYTLLVVRGTHPGPMVAQISTATYEAYNDYGGDDLYPAALRVGVTGRHQGVEVSYDRPYDTATGAGQLFSRDIAMIRFLEREGYPVSYTTDVGADLHSDELRHARVVVNIGHSEYWSQRAHDAYAASRDGGVNLAFFTSDTMGWRVRYAPATSASSEAGRPDHVIIGYKEHVALDPDQSLPSGRFPDGGASITATKYENCITPRLGPTTGPPIYALYSWKPTLRPSWLFAHTGFRAGSSVAGVLGYELDRVAPSPPAGLVLVGGGRAGCQGSIAKSNLAHSVLYRARSGALVFSAGTMGWQLGLSPVPSSSPDAPRAPDPRLVRLTRNLLGRMVGR